MQGVRITILWCIVLATIYAEEGPSTPRDDDPVIQKVRGLRNAGMKANDERMFKDAIEKLRHAISLLHNRVFGEERAAIKDPTVISQDAALYAQILNDYGSVLIRTKQYDEAIEVLEDSVAMIEKIYGDSHPSLGLSLRSLADAYMEKKAFKSAIKRYKTLRKHVKKGLGMTHEAYIEASLKIAEGYKKLNKKDTSRKVLKDTLKAQGGEINGLTIGIAELYMELSSAHVEVGEIDDALRAAETASAIFLQREGKDTMAYAFSLNALAGVKMQQKKVDEAIDLLDRAHNIAVSIYGENDRITLASAKTLQDVKDHKMNLLAAKDEL
ncbi:RxLR-like protein [Plasmopara halstedii]|uniref:Secreted RxLR effector protein RXLR-C07 n=1 Tax=Plasmopara halstedii TaxID=4781 RepID=RLR07_PLAHL|nr:RxLR-like protein [Plasmopara halstedii]A0A0P1AAU8.1 RecName: Full=Secreted RxLR effector protein RXLR-C07; Flags: Precursor [Plasmopara halstedii]CEG37861.1 RxLR-like protein [Plasmopara halstedii]|eukprot:XP_024574230.1 RxLR-like protein [Plasmopara halstedii]